MKQADPSAFSVKGAGSTVEIFSNRIEVTNPGRSLVDVFRILDTPPKSRNEKLSALMRRMKICEELGIGLDKIASSCELHQLPAPRMDLYEESTHTILYSKVKFSDLSMEDRLWSCYLQGEYRTNPSLRKRFGVEETSTGTISRITESSIEKA